MNIFLRPNNCTFQVCNLYPPIPRHQNSQHHCHLYRSLQTRLLQLYYHNLPNSQLYRLQHIQNSLVHAVVKAPKFCHTTPIFKSLHWLKVNERIEYKILSLTYKTLSTVQPGYLHNLISVQPPGRTRSSSLITIAPPPSSSSLKITDRSFRYASPSLWNNLPADSALCCSSSVIFF